MIDNRKKSFFDPKVWKLVQRVSNEIEFIAVRAHKSIPSAWESWKCETIWQTFFQMTCSCNWLWTSSLRSALLIIVTIKWCQFGQFSAQKNTFSSVPLTGNMKILIYIFHSFLCQSLDLENLLGVGENLPFMKDLLTVLDLKKKKRFFHLKTLELLQYIENQNLFLKSESQASERRGNRASRVTLLIPWRRLMIFVRKIEIKPNAIPQNCAVGQV